jgi:glycosyltransferase involved in cell wall biosynthesis
VAAADAEREGAAARLTGVRVLVVSNEQVGVRMAGLAIRALHLAQQLATRGAQVTLAMPEAVDVDGLRVAAFGVPSTKSFRTLAQGHDVVVTQPQRLDIAHALHRSRARVIYDLYVPSFVERVAQLATEPLPDDVRAGLLERDRLEYAAAVRLGAGFICASEQQKDHWLGALGQAGRLDLGILERDARGDLLCGVVPFGVSDAAPALRAGDGALRGALVEADAIPLLWTGGLWNWFDPVTLVEGLARARAREPRLQLVFMGVHHPEAAWEEQEASRAMRARAAELGLLEGGRAAGVVLCDAWVPYDERHRYLLDAAAGVSAHHDSLETRLSFRTRLLDHMWAGLPTVTTRGGELADELIRQGAAIGVADASVGDWQRALLEIAAGAERDDNAAMRAAARRVGERYRWSSNVSALASIVSHVAGGGGSAPARALSAGERVTYMRLLVQMRLRTKGIRTLGAAIRDARSS